MRLLITPLALIAALAMATPAVGEERAEQKSEKAAKLELPEEKHPPAKAAGPNEDTTEAEADPWSRENR